MNTTSTACGTNANGMRFVCRGFEFLWLHPAEMIASDIDCSHLEDEEFEQFVAERTGAAA